MKVSLFEIIYKKKLRKGKRKIFHHIQIFWDVPVHTHRLWVVHGLDDTLIYIYDNKDLKYIYIQIYTIQKVCVYIYIHTNWSAWLSSQKEASSKDDAKKALKQFAEDKQTKDMDYWNNVLWSDETKINLFGSDGVKHVWRQPGELYKDKCVLPTVKHGGGGVIVWGCMSGTGELQFIKGTMNANMYCDILKQSMIPSLRRLGRSAVFQHDNDHCLAKAAEGEGDGLAKHVSRPKPYWASVGHPQTEGGGA